MTLFLAQSQAHFQRVLNPANVANFPLILSWIHGQHLKAQLGWGGCLVWEPLELCLFVQMTCFYWLHQTGNFSTRWDGSCQEAGKEYQTVVVKIKLSCKVKLLIYQSIFVLILNYGHDLWIVTEKFRLKKLRKPWARPRACWRDCISHRTWECVGHRRKVLKIAGNNDASINLLSLLPPRPKPG